MKQLNKILPTGIFKLITITMMVLIFSACDGDGNDASFLDNSSFSSRTVVSCSDSTDVDNYTSLSSGDTIVQGSDDTQISIYHDSDNNKKVCVESGSATISEGNS